MTTQEDFFGTGEPEGVASPHTALMVQRAKEIIWAHEHGKDRSKQRVAGPSELGTECDRKLAYTSLAFPHVNHTQDHWQAYLGTAAHAALAEAYLKADNGSGRFLVEHKVAMILPSGVVIPGSLDVYDRKEREVVDHKFPGAQSRKKYQRSGAPVGYRIQAHVYAYGLEQQGEQPARVANIYYPAEGRLSDAFGWSEPYDRSIALKALERFDRIQQQAAPMADDLDRLEEIPKTTSYLCSYCSYFLPNAPSPKFGCKGKNDG